MAENFLITTTQAIKSASAVLNIDCSNCGNNVNAGFTCLLFESITTVNAPTNPQDGLNMYILFTNTASNWAVSGWNAVFKFSGNASPTIQTGAHDTLIAFHFYAAANKWVEFSREITLP